MPNLFRTTWDSSNVVTEVDLGFSEAGPLLLGVGFVPFDRITPAGKADTSVDPAYFFQVKDVPFGGTLPYDAAAIAFVLTPN